LNTNDGILFVIAESHEEGRKKLLLAVDTSNLESSSAEGSCGERRLRKRPRKHQKKTKNKIQHVTVQNPPLPSSDEEESDDDGEVLTPPQSNVFGGCALNTGKWKDKKIS